MNNLTKKALITDDDPLVCKVIDKILSKHGIQTLVAKDGSSANSAIINEGETLAIAIVDLVLPNGITGWDIIEFIRKTPKTAALPIIVMTGAFLSDAEEKKFADNACTLVRKKDFNIPAFDALIDRLLGGLTQ